MPTYEYQCSRCKKTYELRQGFDAATEHACEECGKGTAKRVLHAPRVLFKGSGFYVTDSKGKSVTAADSAPAKDTATSTEKPAATESKESKGSASTESSSSSSSSTESAASAS